MKAGRFQAPGSSLHLRPHRGVGQPEEEVVLELLDLLLVTGHLLDVVAGVGFQSKT